MIAGQLALIFATLFTGAALYINIAEHPARLRVDDRALLTQWKVAYVRGFAMQAPLAVIGFLAGLVAWRQTGNWRWFAGAIVLVTNWPYTLLGIMPTNKALMSTDPANANAATRALLKKWNRLHAVRTALGAGAMFIFLWASMT